MSLELKWQKYKENMETKRPLGTEWLSPKITEVSKQLKDDNDEDPGDNLCGNISSGCIDQRCLRG